MAINFPSSPTEGQTHVVGGVTWTYTGGRWKVPSISTLGTAAFKNTGESGDSIALNDQPATASATRGQEIVKTINGSFPVGGVYDYGTTSYTEIHTTGDRAPWAGYYYSASEDYIYVAPHTYDHLIQLTGYSVALECDGTTSGLVGVNSNIYTTKSVSGGITGNRSVVTMDGATSVASSIAGTSSSVEVLGGSCLFISGTSTTVMADSTSDTVVGSSSTVFAQTVDILNAIGVQASIAYGATYNTLFRGDYQSVTAGQRIGIHVSGEEFNHLSGDVGVGFGLDSVAYAPVTSLEVRNPNLNQAAAFSTTDNLVARFRDDNVAFDIGVKSTNQAFIQARDPNNHTTKRELHLNPDGGDVVFSGTARRIRGDFSGSTMVNRTFFQTTQDNSATLLSTIPTGTYTISGFEALALSDPTNSPAAQLQARDTDIRLMAGRRGAGAFLPLKFYTSGLSRLDIDVDGKAAFSHDVQVPSLNGGPLAGLRNKIINGEFDVWQRGTSISNLAGVSAYTADRWYCGTSGTTSTISRSTDMPTGMYGYSLRIVDGGDSYTGVTQRIESEVAKSLAGKTVTVSFWIKAVSYAKAFLNVSYANAKDSFGAVTAIINEALDAQITIGTWSYVKSTFAVPAGGANGLSVIIYPNYAYGGASDSYITGVQLEEGPVATPFEQRPIGLELALCQRYYYRVVAPMPGSAFGITTPSYSTVSLAFINAPVTMRVTPTVLDTTGNAADYVHSRYVDIALTAVPYLSSGSNPNVLLVEITLASGVTVGSSGRLCSTGYGIYLGFSAEL